MSDDSLTRSTPHPEPDPAERSVFVEVTPSAGVPSSPPPAEPPVAEPAEPAASPRPPAARRPWLRWLAVAAVVGIVASVAVVGVRAMAGIERMEASLATWESEAEAAFESVPLLTDDEIARLRRSRNARHVELAEAFGVGPPDTRAQADSLAQRYGLVPIETGSLYVVLPGEYSLPLLTPSAAASLDSIAVRFRDRLAVLGLPPFRFSVSSVWRTGADQAALRGVNANAAADRSSHEYGTTYDITYNPTRYSPAPDALRPPPRVDPRVPAPFRSAIQEEMVEAERQILARLAADYPSRLTALLGRALIELEDEGVLAAVRERRQPVYHVTQARRLVEQAP